ncbi:MAG TPA: dihydrolipoyl dehydrogenase, partial [Deltaproteobacteria bacterium]|nr:dihydrolipoyl dehydrogenase [Deltaproteobacteria bacterium]
TIYCGPGGILERVTIMAPHATEIIAWAALAVARRLSVEEFLGPSYPHPTMAELLKEAAADAQGLCINKP